MVPLRRMQVTPPTPNTRVYPNKMHSRCKSLLLLLMPEQNISIKKLKGRHQIKFCTNFVVRHPIPILYVYQK